MTHPLQQINFTNHHQAYVIEASAGTGKTWTIERLYVKALLEASSVTDENLPVSVENILVVTFTNDATNELKERISAQIQTTINTLIYLLNQPLSRDNKPDLFIDYLLMRQDDFDLRKDIILLTRALQNFDQAAIFTIHGFCNRILQDYQLECHSAPKFELTPSKHNIIVELVRNFLRQYIFTNLEFADKLEIVSSNLTKMFHSFDNELTLVDKIADKLPKDILIIKDSEYQAKYNIPVVGQLQRLAAQELSADELSMVKAEFLAAVIDYVCIHYAAESERLNNVSYDELIQMVADRIATSSKLSDLVFERYPVAFIDEFQDTDNLQWQIFGNIYHLAMDKYPTKRGSVVVVGDPKQAIYRFRGADIDTYLMAKSAIGNPLELNQNFRSRPEIMNFINQLFSLENQNCALESSFLGNNIAYSHVDAYGASNLSLPTKEQLAKLAHELEIQQSFYDEPVQLVAITGNSAAERKIRLLQAMTFEILSLLQADSSLKGKIAIIVTKNREASEIISFLRKYGIKAAELKLGNIFATQTAQELYVILQACQNITNRKKLLNALTSQLFNLPLYELINTSSHNSLLEIWQRNFFAYNQIWQQRGVISLVYCLVEDVVAYHDGNQGIISNRELANLYQLAELLHKQSQHVHTQTELMYWFRNKLTNANEQLNNDLEGSNEELVRLDNDDEQIIITTQHKSKGLEYEVLFCPYFKSNIQLDGMYDFNYRRPFFSSYRQDDDLISTMVMDKELGNKIVANDNKEIHRLNYVALTRAKSRIYIYLKQPTISKSTGKYFHAQRPDKLVELFGFVANDPNDASHRLFNYPQFFGSNPEQALKRPYEHPGVVVYQRNNLTHEQLQQLRLVEIANVDTKMNISCGLDFTISPKISYVRQSYSGITRHNNDEDVTDWFIKNETVVDSPNYQFSILQDNGFKGATFGTLFHALCEEYPFTTERLVELSQRVNLDFNSNPNYLLEMQDMIENSFNYPLIDNLCLNQLTSKQHELEFNLYVNDSIELRSKLTNLLAKHYGHEHPFTIASRALSRIEEGFLIGFIDLFFAHDDKYWVLDYKTNTLTNYSGADVANASLANSIIVSMCEHHYYLQYLLYLVAIKRYLEMRLKLDDASHLIGGVVYFYVRGALTVNNHSGDGIFIDRSCQELIYDLDNLLKGQDDAR